MTKRTLLLLLVAVIVAVSAFACVHNTAAARQARSIRCAVAIAEELTAHRYIVGDSSMNELTHLERDAVPGLLLLLDASDWKISTKASSVLKALSYGITYDKLNEGGYDKEEHRYLPWAAGVIDKGLNHRRENTRGRFVLLLPLLLDHPVDRLVEAASDESAFVRRYALNSLYRISPLKRLDPELAQALDRLLEDDAVDVRAGAAAVAAVNGYSAARDRLLEMLDSKEPYDDKNTGMYYWAPLIEGKNRSGNWPPEGQPELYMREIAAWSLQKLTDKDYGFESAYKSRDDMPEIITRIKEDLAEE